MFQHFCIIPMYSSKVKTRKSAKKEKTWPITKSYFKKPIKEKCEKNKYRKLKMSNNWIHQQSRVTIDTQDVLTISILTVMKTSIKKSINHDSLFKEIDHQYQSFMRKIEIGCTGYEFIPSFQVRFTWSLVWCVCFVDRCLSFCTFFL